MQLVLHAIAYIDSRSVGQLACGGGNLPLPIVRTVAALVPSDISRRQGGNGGIRNAGCAAWTQDWLETPR